MRRRLHIVVALLTFTAGFLTVGPPGRLAYALPAALVILLLLAQAGRLRGAGYDAHCFKVAAVTFVLWIPLLALFSQVLAPPGGSCVYLPENDEGERAEAPPPVYRAEPAHVEGVGEPCDVGESYSVGERANLTWAGVLDRKALSKPAARRPPDAAAAEVSGTVAVAVVVGESGLVHSARAISGHPLLRREAERAACLARFRPAHVSGPPLKVRGVLTYRFDR